MGATSNLRPFSLPHSSRAVRSPMSANPKPVEHSRTMLADVLGYDDRQLNDLSGRGILGGG